jgi:hypothetical protein
MPGEDAYHRHKQRAAKRQQGLSLNAREIGPLPKCANKRRRAKAEKSLLDCCKIYFSGRFPLSFSDDHLEQIEHIQRVIVDGGLQAIAAPRGDGKSTRLEAGIIWGVVVTALHPYAVLLAAVGKQASKLMSSIKTELITNELLLADFPEVCYPIAKMAGIANRCTGQLLDGENTWPAGGDQAWSKSRIVLPTVEGSPCSGAVIEASGLLEATRGIKFARSDGTIQRPTLALIDDPQTQRSAKSPIQCQDREEAISSGILYLPGPGRMISALAAVTVIKPGDASDQMLKRDQHPEWHGIRKKMLEAWPAGCDPRAKERIITPEDKETAFHWEKYADIYRDELAAGGSGKKTTRYYRKHRKAMDRGAKASWQHRKPGCLSAIEFAMRLFIRDRDSFLAECQNDPEYDQQGEDFETLTAVEIAGRVNGSPRGQVPPEARRLTFSIDVHKELLYWAVVAWGEGFTGWVLDYGTWPKQTAKYFAMKHARQTIAKHPEITATTMEGKVRQALDACAAELVARDWATADGELHHLERGLCDANWGQCTNVVYAFCREARRKHGLQIMPAHGMAFGPAKCPISRWSAKQVKGLAGDEWHVPPPARGRGIRAALFDAGRRKTFLQQRFATAPGDEGSLSFFHAEPNRHRLISEHAASERGVKVSGPYGELIEWRLQPGQDNHYLDCLSMAATAESICGGRLLPPKIKSTLPDPKAETATAPKKRRQRVSYLQL